MTAITDAPGMLRVKLRDDQSVSGSGNNYPTVLVVAEHAERAAFARTALAVKLRELDSICAERERLQNLAFLVTKECQALARECAVFDSDLDLAIRGNLRRAP